MKTQLVASQIFRNAYEAFYNAFRNYLWPYDVLEVLADLEVEIYSAFFSKDKLVQLFNNLKQSAMQAVEEYDDTDLKKRIDALEDLIINTDYNNLYQHIGKVEEVNPDEDKQIKPAEEDNEGDLEQENDQGEFEQVDQGL